MAVCISESVRVKWVDDRFEPIIQIAHIEVKRESSNRRWRFSSGPYAGKHHIVKAMVGWYSGEVELTPSEIALLEDFVDLLGDCIDDMTVQVRDVIRNKYKPIQKPINFYPQELRPTDSPAPIATYLYLMRHQNGLIKIGRSVNPKARERTLQAEDPRLELIATREGTTQEESRLHAIFSDKRVRGEWFDLSCHQLEWLLAFFGGGNSDVS